MPNQGQKIFLKGLLLLGLVKWYNVALIVISQYMVAKWVFNPEEQILSFLSNFRLHLLVLSTSLVFAGGFIINAFYDVEKDLINKRSKVIFDRLVGRNLALNIYVILNVIAALLAFLASFKIFIYILIFIFLLWFYSHKLQKISLIREVTASLLLVSTLLSINLHYGHFHIPFLFYVGILTLIFFNREVIKDLEGNKGNIIYGYQTVVNSVGLKFTRIWLFTINILCGTAVILAMGALKLPVNYFSAMAIAGWAGTTLISLVLFKNGGEAFFEQIDAVAKVLIVVYLLTLPLSHFIIW